MALLPRKRLFDSALTVLGGVRCYYPKGWKTPQVTHDFNNVMKWEQPEKLRHWDPQRTCDLYPLPKIDPTWLRLEYRPFAHLIESLPEDQRKLFTVGYGPRRDGVDVIREDLLSKVRRNKYDKFSKEVKIAEATLKIRNYQDQFAKFPVVKKSGMHRHRCKEMIDRRQKLLRQLRTSDYKRFEWILELLGVIYKLKPPNCLIERKASLNVLVNLFCNEIRDQRMEEYKKMLDAEKVPFLEKKLQTLFSIKADEEMINVPCSVDSDIKSTQALIETLKSLQQLTIYPVESATKQIT